MDAAYAPAEPRRVHLRGVVEEEPVMVLPSGDPNLRSFPRGDATRTILGVTELERDGAWRSVSGRAQMRVTGWPEGIHVGDEVDVIGRLGAPREPMNPGELDEAARLRDQRIRVRVLSEKPGESVVRLTEGWRYTRKGWLAAAKGWGQRALRDHLPQEQAGVAQALLLGRGAAMVPADWNKYERTGVVYVLIISGFHLAVLGWFVNQGLWLVQVERRHRACVVALVLLGYALLTGLEIATVRSAAMACVLCGGIVLRRPTTFANSLSLAWLVILLLNPTDMFSLGCQLSFLAVAVLYWIADRLFRRPSDPLDKLVEESRPLWQRRLFWLGRVVSRPYVGTLMVWLAQAPLLSVSVHTFSPIALLIAPPMALLAAVALLSGLLLLAACALYPPAAWIFAHPTQWSLAACDWLISSSAQVPGAYWYASGLPGWWLWTFYPALLAVLLLEPLQRRWRWMLLAGLGWLCIGLLAGPGRPPSGELRCTFLAVGHGGCTVLETPDGRVLLYDAGTMDGPEVTRRQIAPFLWSRGIHRIDEILLSHADLDHYNGVRELVEYFSVGQVTCTPTFQDKPIKAVRLTLDELQCRRIPVRTIHAGEWLAAGDVQMEVLHPPPAGPEGKENERSLVLLVRHAGHVILLTGDLEGAGLLQVLRHSPVRADVLLAPHHGSRASNTPELARWARPSVVIACQGPAPGPPHAPDPYTAAGAQYLGTWLHGAVTVRSHRTGLVVETFRTKQRLAVRLEGAR